MFNLLFRFGRIACVLLAGVLVYPSVAFAQGPTLAEIARKEQERRKTTKNSDKVLTNKDLPPPAAKPATAAAAPAAAVDAAAPKAEAKPAGEPEKDEAWWKQRMVQARESLRRNEAFLDALQSRINSLSADFVARDDPYQRAKIGEDRQKALAEMERVQTEIALGKKQITDIEEEARKASVPPGWLR
jgi:type IV secretory pathway VirB10-like protein